MPGDSGVLVVARVRSTTTKCTRDRGCNGHPAFPTPSFGRKVLAQLGRIAPRDCGLVSEIGAEWLLRHAVSPVKPGIPPTVLAIGPVGSPGEAQMDARLTAWEPSSPPYLAQISGLYRKRLAIPARCDIPPAPLSTATRDRPHPP